MDANIISKKSHLQLSFLFIFWKPDLSLLSCHFLFIILLNLIFVTDKLYLSQMWWDIITFMIK